MKIGICSFYETYNIDNKIFEHTAYNIGENLEYPFVQLRDELIKNGNSLDTLDQYPLEQYQKIIFLDLPDSSKIDLKKLANSGIDLYLIILESPIIRPDNMDTDNHKYFKKVFSWSDDLSLKGGKYVKLNIAHKFPEKISSDITAKHKLCTMVVSNKSNANKNELYNERYNLAKWFQDNHPDDFDLYGRGWDKFIFSHVIIKKMIKKIKILKKIFVLKQFIYKGTVNSKISIMAKYKFSIAYENVFGYNGYITEKIFDSFFAGCVPVYWGAPNVCEHIPKNCFIDRRDFSCNKDLYVYLKNLTDEKHVAYLENITKFLESNMGKMFSSNKFAETIIKEILT